MRLHYYHLGQRLYYMNLPMDLKYGYIYNDQSSYQSMPI